MRTLALALCAACSFTHGQSVSGGDGGTGSGDGSVARKQMEVVSGAGRVHAGAKTIDVEIGHGVLVRQSTAGNKTISGSPVVKP